ncbi:uncharacterized protein TM35_000881070 [Trypanosoma theileri]|uniref:Uncharacterized protein n=1 Tax=Trypanosoma theileri TaxID=67003 RepID=A0A1X0NG64_9TRYP|nr:uncharacterized protein TM35_000881070 [Trypanosoma theileri]ORC82528.1 hypothetical protein TM35_000881070 [Trypanosoma theileri]
MFEVGGLLKNQILFIFLFNTCVLGNGIPLVTFGPRKLEPMSIIPYYFGEAMGHQIFFLESLRVHKLQTSYNTVASGVVLRQNFIQEAPGVRISVPSAAVSFIYCTLVRMLLNKGWYGP